MRDIYQIRGTEMRKCGECGNWYEYLYSTPRAYYTGFCIIKRANLDYNCSQCAEFIQRNQEDNDMGKEQYKKDGVNVSYADAHTGGKVRAQPPDEYHTCMHCANFEHNVEIGTAVSSEGVCKETNELKDMKSSTCKYFCISTSTTGNSPTNDDRVKYFKIPIDKFIDVLLDDRDAKWILSKEYNSDSKYEEFACCFYGYEVHVYARKTCDTLSEGIFGLTVFPIGAIATEESKDIYKPNSKIGFLFHKAKREREKSINDMCGV